MNNRSAGYVLRLRGAGIFVHEGYVLLHRLVGDSLWALPGGKVEPGEEASAAVVREMQEELGVHVTCGELLFVVENFFSHAGAQNHEVGLYFQASLGANSLLLEKSKSHPGVEGHVELEFKWFPRESLAQVNLRPEFLRDKLAHDTESCEHITQWSR